MRLFCMTVVHGAVHATAARRCAPLLYVHVGKAGGTTARRYIHLEVARCVGNASDAARHYVTVHLQPLKPEQLATFLPSSPIVISVRDPYARMVSAYNWGHPNRTDLRRPVPEHGGSRSEQFTREAYRCFPTLDALMRAVVAADRSARSGGRAGAGHARAARTPCDAAAHTLREMLADMSPHHAPRSARLRHFGMGHAFYLPTDVRKRLLGEATHVYALRQECLALDLASMSRWLESSFGWPPAPPSAKAAPLPQKKSEYQGKGKGTPPPDVARAFRTLIGAEDDVYAQILRKAVNTRALSAAQRSCTPTSIAGAPIGPGTAWTPPSVRRR